MTTFKDKIEIEATSIENIDVTEIDKVSNWLPSNGIVDLNIAEQGLILTLHAQNMCQEKIIQIEKIIGTKETEKSRAWSKAALEKAKLAGYKTVKDKEWFAQADEDYIEACNELILAKACKKWFENKASHFSSWHYAFKTFLRRDYSLEKIANFQTGTYNIDSPGGPDQGKNTNDLGGDTIEWK